MGTRPYTREMVLCPAAGLSDTQASLCKLPPLSLCVCVRLRQECGEAARKLVYRMLSIQKLHKTTK